MIQHNMVNKVILIGNVGMDPEIRTLESGVKVARLRLATTERIFDRQTNETKELTEWHTVTLWRGLADVADRFVHKGSQIYVEGSLRTREWTDRDNQKRTSVGQARASSAAVQHEARAMPAASSNMRNNLRQLHRRALRSRYRRLRSFLTTVLMTCRSDRSISSIWEV